MNLDLSPNEYLETSRDIYETAMKLQNARSEGIEKARLEHQKEQDAQREREKAQREVERNLNEKYGAT